MEIELADHFDRMNKVVEELLRGNNPTQIATLTGLKRAEVIELIDEWKNVVHNDTSARERAKEAISGADQHYAMLIKKNISYGNSALDPVRIFSKAGPREQLYVRIDDKLNRLIKGEEYPGDNDIDDLIGYLILLKVAKEFAISVD